MPISDAQVGRSYPPTEPYEVSRAKIAEFAAALGDPKNPAYRGKDAIAPPTFAATISAAAWGALFADPDVDMALSRCVHVDQRFDYERPLRAGDEITATLTIEKVRVRGATAIVTFSVALNTTAGELVCTARTTLMHQEVK
jgi:acyl dehydratase